FCNKPLSDLSSRDFSYLLKAYLGFQDQILQLFTYSCLQELNCYIRIVKGDNFRSGLYYSSLHYYSGLLGLPSGLHFHMLLWLVCGLPCES
ncbi:hypothetical protein AKJ16_DCAP04702, partial [Drosera capensis]